MIPEKKDMELTTIDSDDEEEEKVEQKVVQSKEIVKVQKDDDEVTDDDELTKEKILETIRKSGGVQLVGDSYHNHVSYEQDVIEKEFVKYLVQNNLVVIDVVDHLSEELVEILVERMSGGDDSGAKEEFTKINL